MTELSAPVVTISYFIDAMPAARPNKSATEPVEVAPGVVAGFVPVADLDVVAAVVAAADLDVATAVDDEVEVVCELDGAVAAPV